MVHTEAMMQFQGQATSFENTESYVVMSCAHLHEFSSSACFRQCAEIWCNGCTLETRHVVQVVDQCSNCEISDLVLSSSVYAQAFGSNADWSSVQWRCVECGLSSGGSLRKEGDDVLDIEGATCPGSGSSVDIASIIEVNGTMLSAGNTTTLAVQDVIDSSGNSTFSDLNLSSSLGSGNFAAVIEIPSTDRNNDSQSANASGSRNDNSVWVDFGSIHNDTKPVNGVTASLKPTFPSIPISVPALASSSPSEVPGMTAISPSSGAPTMHTQSIPPLVTLPASSRLDDGSTSFSVDVANTTDENSRDKTDSSSSSDGQLGNTSTVGTPFMSPPPSWTTTSPTPQSPGIIDKRSSDGNFSATSAVTRSPFFYASLVLGVVGLIGIIAGCRAKRQRNHRDAMRALRISTRTPTPGSNSRSVPMSRLDSPNIIIL